MSAQKIWQASWWIIAAAILVGALAHPPRASAAPWDDPHHPDLASGTCFTGMGGFPVLWNAVCDGEPYDDGSYWHQGTYFAFGGTRITTFCVLAGDVWHPRAPQGAGFCGGEW